MNPFNFGPPQQPTDQDDTFEVLDAGSVTWRDVVGQDEAVKALREAIEFPYSHRDLYAAYGQKPAKGVLLFGPPGCGKTMLAKAAANAAANASATDDELREAEIEADRKRRAQEQQRRRPRAAMGSLMFDVVEIDGVSAAPQKSHRKIGKPTVLYVKGGELHDKFIGEAENKVRKVFKAARLCAAETKRRTILFIDEAEALLGDRATWGRSMATVPGFLAELDGLTTNDSVFVILATNMPSEIDPAIQRDGRIDRRIQVGRPGRDAVTGIAAGALRDRPLHKGVTLDDAAAAIVNDIWLTEVASLQGEIAGEQRSVALLLGDLVSGAIVVGIVQRATQLAIARDVEAKVKKPSGITLRDLAQAVAASAVEQRSLDLRAAFAAKIVAEYGAAAAVPQVATQKSTHLNYN
jgi:proteasome-associated ATPase